MAEPFDFPYDEYAGLELTDLDLVDVLADDAAIEALRHDDVVPAQDQVLASLAALSRATATDLPKPEPVHRSSDRVRTGVRVAAAAVTALAFAAGTGMAAARSTEPFQPIRDLVEWGLTIGERAASPSRDVERGAAGHPTGKSSPGPSEPQIVASRQILTPDLVGAAARPETASDGREMRTARAHQPSRGGDHGRPAADDRRRPVEHRGRAPEERRPEHDREAEGQEAAEDPEMFTLLTEDPDQEPSGDTEEPADERTDPSGEPPAEDSGEDTPDDSGEETPEDEPEDPGPSPSPEPAPR